MVYLISLIFVVLILLNSYVSKVILFDPYNSRNQKLLQLGFVWALPFFGAIVSLHILSSLLGAVSSEKKNVMEFTDNWASAIPENDNSASSNHSLD